MRARCKFCGRALRYAKIPNRGPVMAHGKGEAEICRRLIASGQDIPTREARRLEEEAARRERLAKFKDKTRNG